MGKDSPMYAVDKDEDICEFNDQYLLRAIPVEGCKLKELVLLLQQQSTPHIARGTMQCRFNFPHSTTSIAEPCPDPEARDKAHHLLSKVRKVYIYTYIYIYIYIYKNINNCNASVMLAWQANMDFQFALNAYACT